MHAFYTPENIRKSMFSGVEKRCIGNKRVNNLIFIDTGNEN